MNKHIILYFFVIIIIVLDVFVFYKVQKDKTEDIAHSSQIIPLQNSINTNVNAISEDDSISKIPLQQKVGQMLIVGFHDTSVSTTSIIIKTINDLNLGGLILFDHNIENPTQLKKLIYNIKQFTNSHLFISVDLEGGEINRLKSKNGFMDFPSAQSLGTIGDLAEIQNDGINIGTELSNYGFNMNFAPVVDININPSNPIIGKLGRSFSSDPQQVITEAKTFIDGLHSKNIISVIKHFPGHGSSVSDSHLGFVDITKTYQQKELLPFQKLENDTDAIMVAHVTNKNIDPNYPASLSPLFIQNILRNQLSYNGVIISDDMEMGVISKNYTLEKAIILAINSGNDILIFSNNNDQMPYKVNKIILDAINNGEISIDTINIAYKRIQKLKTNYNL